MRSPLRFGQNCLSKPNPLWRRSNTRSPLLESSRNRIRRRPHRRRSRRLRTTFRRRTTFRCRATFRRRSHRHRTTFRPRPPRCRSILHRRRPLPFLHRSESRQALRSHPVLPRPQAGNSPPWTRTPRSLRRSTTQTTSRCFRRLATPHRPTRRRLPTGPRVPASRSPRAAPRRCRRWEARVAG